jgi:hypothetical protein
MDYSAKELLDMALKSFEEYKAMYDVTSDTFELGIKLIEKAQEQL